MKILIISSNREKVPYPVMPAGAAAVATTLKEKGHPVRFLDLCFLKEPLAEVKKAIKDFEPEAIGISMRNLDNCDYAAPVSYLPEVERLIYFCRHITQAPILLGGSAVGVMPEAVCRRVKPDYVVVGDGEETSVKWVEALETGKDPALVGGIGCVRDGMWKLTPSMGNPSFEHNATPRIFQWTDIKPYFKYESFYPIQTKRGCALKCIYCTYKNIEGTSYRFKAPGQIADEIEEALAYDPNAKFEFVDSTFNSPVSHAFRILNCLKERKIKARFVGSGINPISAPRELFAAMKETGFESLICTAENASEKVLANLKKGFTRKHLQKVAASIRAEGLQTLWIFLMGGPGEDKETVKESLDFIHNELGPKDVAYITSGLRIYPNTELAQIALKEKVIHSQEQLLEPVFYFSQQLDPRWLLSTLKEHSRKDPRILRSVDAEHPWVPALCRIINLFGSQKPFWTYTPVLNRMLHWGRAS